MASMHLTRPCFHKCMLVLGSVLSGWTEPHSVCSWPDVSRIPSTQALYTYILLIYVSGAVAQPWRMVGSVCWAALTLRGILVVDPTRAALVRPVPEARHTMNLLWGAFFQSLFFKKKKKKSLNERTPTCFTSFYIVEHSVPMRENYACIL